MKKYILFSLLVVIACASAAEYTGKYDHIDVDAILKNGRVLTNYIKCLLDKGPCTNEGRELKRTLPDALMTGCSKCSDNQKIAAEKVINHLRTRKPQDWETLLKKFDPRGEYRKRYEAEQGRAL